MLKIYKLMKSKFYPLNLISLIFTVFNPFVRKFTKLESSNIRKFKILLASLSMYFFKE